MSGGGEEVWQYMVGWWVRGDDDDDDDKRWDLRFIGKELGLKGWGDESPRGITIRTVGKALQHVADVEGKGAGQRLGLRKVVLLVGVFELEAADVVLEEEGEGAGSSFYVSVLLLFKVDWREAPDRGIDLLPLLPFHCRHDP